MQGEKVISALIGLTGAVANNGKTEHTDQVVREAVLQLSDSSREAELVEKIHTEKLRIAPDCATCTHPCGNTSDYEIEKLRIKAAMYHAFFFHNSDLAKRLRDQNEENDNALIGEFDGFSYASWRRNAIFRSLEDMRIDGLLTEEEYRECMNV